MSEDWSRAEVEAIVSDYFAMLAKEFRDEPYNKTRHRETLLRLLRGRTASSVELKHRNISAVLRDLDFPWIAGYKPARHYQHLLFEVVSRRLGRARDLHAKVDQQVMEPASAPTSDRILGRLVPAPKAPRESGAISTPIPDYMASKPGKRTDYFARESRNASLGAEGEKFVMLFERERLRLAGRSNLAEKVEHVTQTRGDGLGFDILSYDEDGADRLIEVKTTRYAMETPFYVTGNEVAVSREFARRYHLYRVFEYETSRRLFTLSGSLDEVCRLDPVEFRGMVR